MSTTLLNAGDPPAHSRAAPGFEGPRNYAGGVLTVRRVPHGDPDAVRLWEAMWAEIVERYGGDPGYVPLPSDGLVANLVGYVGDEPVGTVAVRFKAYGTWPPFAEIKRLYVDPGHRKNGFSRILMGAAEDAARRAGATRVILETGTEQPEALALYRAIGYGDIAPYGEFAHDPRSRCFAKDLPTRLLVVSGTMGAGKSAVASAIGDLLGAQGARYAWIDADALCQAGPVDADDPYQQRLLFDALAGAAPAFRARGFGLVVVARVVEDPADRERYARAFRSDGGPAEVTIVRVAAPEEVRFARLDAREPEGPWRDFARARTVELEDALVANDLDDFVFDNDGQTAAETAAAVVETIGWGTETL